MTEPRDTNSNPSERSPARHRGRLVTWLFNPGERRFILPATGVWILVLDWLLFSSNMLSAWLAAPVAILLGFVLGSAGAFLVQRRAAGDTRWSAAIKALLAGIVVGVPWPIGGTIVGGWVILTSGLADAKKEILHK